MSDSDFFISSDEEDVPKKKKTLQKKPKDKENKAKAPKKAVDIDTTMTEEDRNVFRSIDNKGGKKTAIEDIYQKKSQLEHILLRPDTYIGSVEYTDKSPMWVFDPEENKLVYKDVTYVPGLYKIFDEILVNAADNKQRDPKMSLIKIDIDKARNKISIYNNGKGIPVVMHKVEKVYVPELIFGTLLTSSNYDDSEKKVTGGRNGYGAKLCNIFSTEFILETSSKEYGKCFKQKWVNNMTKEDDPVITNSTTEDYTKVTFKPDLAKFKMTELDDDIIQLMMRRAYDVAGSTKGVKVFLNGKLVPVQGFKQYVELYTKENISEDAKIVYEVVNNRWEVALTVSDNGFKQVSFVNSIATTKGGRHVDYVADQMVAKMIDVIKKKVGSKSTVNVKPFQVKNHMWVFVNCLIENPTFDSQTKETMTLQSKSFGSKCDLSDSFSKSAQKCGVVDAVLSWVRYKQQEDLNKKCSSKKTSKLKGIPKLEDANDAGTKNSRHCTLILTEGDSAKTLAVSGLAVVGRDRYGVFPLRGKLLNVREGNMKQVADNAEINALIRIIGLQYKKNYQTDDDFNSLRYGSVMIMADQDQDGSHIKGLVINFIHSNWPSLIQRNFVEQFITPIVKAIRGKEELSFFSLPEYHEWKNNAANSDRYRIKYYKGLGTSTSKEAKEYFSDMGRHRIKFKYGGKEDDEAVNMAFSKKKVDERKDWLTKWMTLKKERRAQGLEEEYLYNKDTKTVTYNEFINKELILFSNTDNERSIPCLVDGFKPGQRKVMFTCFKRADKREVKVAQLAGAVGELSAYHHGEQSLMGTIVNLAQDYVGSNNLNMLLPIGQFGTRLQGGKDSASPRYIFTKLNPVTRHVFPVADDNVLRFLFEDNQRIEPEWYCPIIPMILVNGASGIGTGWSTNIPNYCPRQVAQNIRRLIRGEEQKPLIPWFKGFRGKIVQLDDQHFACYGIVSRLDDDTVEITELPIRKWTQEYKENVLEPMMEGNESAKEKGKGKKKDAKDGEKAEKVPAIISDFKEYHTDTTVRFVVKFAPGQLKKAEQTGIYKVLKLYQTISNTSMVLFDAAGCLRTFRTPEEICSEFFDTRKAKYIERKAFLEGMLKAQSDRLSNQARFILAKISGDIVMENKKKAAIIEQLIKHKFDPDPVKTWKDMQKKRLAELYGEDEEENQAEEDDGDEEREQTSEQKKAAETDRKMSDYDYLVGMALIKLSEEEKNKMLKESEEKLHELKSLQRKTWADLWNEDLDTFEVELLKQEEKEKADQESAIKKKTVEMGKGKKNKGIAAEVLPSKDAVPMEPEMDNELKAKYAPKKERVKKEPKAPKEPKQKKEGGDIKKFLSPKQKKEEYGMSGSSDEEMDIEDDFSEGDDNDNADSDASEIMPTKKNNRNKARDTTQEDESSNEAPQKKKKTIDSDNESEDEEPVKKAPVKKAPPPKTEPTKKGAFDYDSDEDDKPKRQKKDVEVFDIPSDSDDDNPMSKPKKTKAEPKIKAEGKPKTEPKPKSAAPKPKAEKKADPPAKKMTDFFNKKKKSQEDSDSDVIISEEDSMEMDASPPKPRATSGRARAKATNYNVDASDSEEDVPKKKKKIVVSDEDSDF